MSSLEPFISIIIPTYNAADTIADCLRSIATQTYKRFEVIVVDGLSADDTTDITRSFERKGLKVRILSEMDKGIYDAMNKGINLARGRYLYFLGSDDSLYNNEILSDIATLLYKVNPKVLYGNVRMLGKSDLVPNGLIHAGEFDLKRLISENICHQSIFYHRDLFETIGSYNVQYPVMADHDFNLRAFAKFHFVYTDKIVANFSLGGQSSRVQDPVFGKDKDSNIIRYFFNKLHTSDFIKLRLYIKKAAFSKNVKVSLLTRIYCMAIYFKAKAQSFFT